MFKNNRERLNKLVLDDSLVILLSGKEIRKSADEIYDFQVNKNFYYFTNLDEPENILMLVKNKGIMKEYLFIPENDPKLVKWLGEKVTIEKAKEKSEIENILYLTDFESSLNENLKNIKNVYLDLEEVKDYKYVYYQNLKTKIEKLGKFDFHNVHEICKELRLVKSEYEIDLIKKAISITNKGILEVLNRSKEGLYEYQLESYFDQSIKYLGAKGFAFKSIFASGINGCTLHYSRNNSILNNDELVLIDLGANFNYYNADISRTFPVNGKFTDLQKQIYQIVLNGQKLIMNTVKVGMTLKELNNVLIEYYFDELKKIGLVNKLEDVRKYYFHSVSHHLGLDTHDDVSYKPLEEGNVITVEPGLYIEEYKIGIRIEDNVLIKKDGIVNLSKEIIKEIDDIEKAMKK